MYSVHILCQNVFKSKSSESFLVLVHHLNSQGHRISVGSDEKNSSAMNFNYLLMKENKLFSFKNAKLK